MKCGPGRNRKGQWCLTETANYKMTNRFGQFNKDHEEAFNEAALEKYDFQTCQRDDGSLYGTGGQCRLGAPTTKPEKETKSKSSGGGGGGSASSSSGGSGGQDGPQATSSQRQAAMKNLRREENTLKNKQAEQGGKLSKADSAKLDRIKASQREYEIQGKQKMKAQTSDKGVARKEAKASGEVADRKAAARKENEAKKEASARTDSKMSSKRAAEVKAKFDADRKRKAGGQDGPEATTKQRAAAVKNLTRQKNTLLNKQDDNGKLSKADSAKLKLIEASMESYR